MVHFLVLAGVFLHTDCAGGALASMYLCAYCVVSVNSLFANWITKNELDCCSLLPEPVGCPLVDFKNSWASNLLWGLTKSYIWNLENVWFMRGLGIILQSTRTIMPVKITATRILFFVKDHQHVAHWFLMDLLLKAFTLCYHGQATSRHINEIIYCTESNTLTECFMSALWSAASLVYIVIFLTIPMMDLRSILLIQLVISVV